MILAITRTDLTAAELQQEVRRSREANQARRRSAITLVLEGRNRIEVSENPGLQRQTLRDWVHR